MTVDPVRAAATRPMRLDSITGLRWFAAFAVFMHHFNGVTNSGYAKVPLLYPRTQFGVHGVAFFFVLSGFVLTWSYRAGTPLGHFYWRRFARIWPLHLAATAIAVPIFYPLSNQAFDWWPFASSLVLIQAWFPHIKPTFPGNGVSWTLSCEVFFYALFPFLAVVLARLRRGAQAVVVIVLVAAAFGWRVYSDASIGGPLAGWSLRTPVFRLWEFVLGITLALAMKSGWRVRGGFWAAVAAIFAWIFVYFDLSPHLSSDVARRVVQLDQVVVPLLFAWLIGTAAQRDLDGRRWFMASRPVVLLGAWSYAFYLVHQSVIRYATMTWGIRKPSDENLFDMLGMAVVATALAATLYYLVERPFELRLRRLLRPRGERRLAAAQDVPTVVASAEGLPQSSSDSSDVGPGDEEHPTGREAVGPVGPARRGPTA